MKKVNQKELEEKVEIYFQKIDLSERIKCLVDSVMTFPVRLGQKNISSRRHKQNNLFINSMSKHLYREEIKNNPNFYQIYNLSLYLILLLDDIEYFHDGLVFANGRRKKQFYAKHIAALLYESSDDLKNLLGNQLRVPLITLQVPSDIVTGLEEIKSGLKTFRKNNTEFLYSIRNIAGSHRDQNTILYLETLESINPTKLVTITSEFVIYTKELFAVLTKICQSVNRPEILYRELIVNNKK